MNRVLKPTPWLLLSITAVTLIGFPEGYSAQALAQAAKCQSHPPHLHANLWMQTSAEYQALCWQTFSAALKEVRQAVKSAKRRGGRPTGPGKKPLAVVADLDETILDNARFQSEMDVAVMLSCSDPGYTPGRWKQWERDNADEVGLVPGAGPFVAEVERLKVVMVYISNRVEDLRASTIRSLANSGVNTQRLEDGLEPRLLLKRDTSDKQDRIRQAEEQYHVVAYLGDNLGDFPGAIAQSTDVAGNLTNRLKKVEAAGNLWGTRWFMLPNPVYGDWDRALPDELAERLLFLKRASTPAFVEAK